jgi:hypothetical protein
MSQETKIVRLGGDAFVHISDRPWLSPVLEQYSISDLPKITWWVEQPSKAQVLSLWEDEVYLIWGKVKCGADNIYKSRAVNVSTYRQAWNPEGLILQECAEIEKHLRGFVPNPDVMDAE